MVALPNCCGCASLQTGTRIIGALDLVASIILLVFSIPFLAESTAFIGLVEELDDIDRQAISSSGGLLIIGVAMLIGAIFSIVICACLVHGARTRNVCLMSPWMGLTVMGLTFGIFNIVRALISLAFVDVVISILGWVLRAYFCLVVWSFKNEIGDVADHQGEVISGVRGIKGIRGIKGYKGEEIC